MLLFTIMGFVADNDNELRGEIRMKKLSALVLAIVMMAGLVAGCGSNSSKPAAGGGEVSLKVAHAAADNTAKHAAWLNFKKLVEERSGGKIKVAIFPNAQLGSEREYIEALQVGNIAMASVSTAPVANFKKEFYAFDIPFLFKNRETAHKVVDGPVGQEILAGLDSIQIKGLGFWENGFRHMTNNKVAIRKPDDLKGLKMRTMENELHMALFKALGANPTPMAYGEVFTALQQGTVDGQETPFELIHTNRFYEVQKYVIDTGHLYSPFLIMMSKQVYEKLSPEHRKIVEDAVKETTKMQRELAKKNEAIAIDAIKTKSTIINLTDEERKAFRDKMGPVNEQAKQKAGDAIVTKILEASK